ncbi:MULTISPECIES: RidA family protein [Bacillus]|uniref:RidA family protein n=1 Tax=Bacillus TaxID=1386 RepID=UPI000771C7C3|nr:MULTISPECIES: RidA family protein [Bacillus]OUA68160.1 enamine deaminase RidA [Bacillus thuringiensis serovar thailandensis]QXW42368.1 RidA family protein [Klebsiella grimontii]KAB7631103.1 RidA family protein [Bacillus sp. B4-WWTP-NA-D-NA-NA]KXI54726.1 enamine deaminase RidA [Bacillus cereus]MCU5385026.1 RidA family protein [Bacillus cereus]
MKKIIRKNPKLMPKPLGDYSHITRVPNGAALIVTSGQVGTDMKGNVPKSLNDQIANTFANMKKILESEGLSQKNVIKVNIWATEEIDWDYFDLKWIKFFDNESPSMTIAYITALGLPELKIEIELWCAEN